jgi:hypothetical protein
VPITNTVSVTISPPIRVFALVGLLAATAIGAFLFLVGRTAEDGGQAVTRTPATKPAGETTPAAPKAPTSTSRTPRPRPTVTFQTKSGFPVPIDRALRRHKVVVVAVYMPGAGVDSVVRREARAAARMTGAGFVSLSALSNKLMRPLVAKTGVLPDPAVLIVKRGGVLAATLSVTDRDTVAQAVTQARQ